MLHRLHILKPSYRAYESLRAWRADRDAPQLAPDGLPVPPAKLRVLVAGTADLEWFITSGERDAEIVRDVLAEADTDLERVGSLLDFGCGCGRVLRHFRDVAVDVAIHGCDHKRDA